MPPAAQPEDSLSIRAAWLHHTGGMTQADVALRLGVSTIKAHRLIAQANQNGAVRVTVEGDVSECLALESALIRRYRLTRCEVVPDLLEPGLPLRALGAAGASFLKREIAARAGGVIGIGHGRTLAAAIAALPRMEVPDLRFVSLLGGLTRTFAANPHDVMHRLSERTGAEAYILPVPFLADSVADRRVFLGQRGVRMVRDMAARADLMVVGIGTVDPDAQLVAARMVGAAEMRAVRAAGGLGEVLGHFFDAEGQPVACELTDRTVAPDLAMLRDRPVVAIAGGAAKVAGLRAVLLGGCLGGLVTDEATARALEDLR